MTVLVIALSSPPGPVSAPPALAGLPDQLPGDFELVDLTTVLDINRRRRSWPLHRDSTMAPQPRQFRSSCDLIGPDTPGPIRPFTLLIATVPQAGAGADQFGRVRCHRHSALPRGCCWNRYHDSGAGSVVGEFGDHRGECPNLAS